MVAEELLEFINASWTPFHAVHEAKKRLLKAGFSSLSERDTWHLEAGGKYFFTRNHSSIVAFVVGKKFVPGNGFWIVACHTDSPCPKLKPVSKLTKGGFLQVGVSVYGGGLWHTWFDRDLSVAGRVMLQSAKTTKAATEKSEVEGEDKKEEEEEKGEVFTEVFEHKLVRIDRPILRIPTLAIHLTDASTAGFKPNTQTQFAPVLATSIKAELNKTKSSKPQPNGSAGGAPAGTAKSTTPEEPAKHHAILLELLAEELGCKPEDICDFELSVCDTQPGRIGGAFNEFVFVGRLDNLCCTFTALKAFIDSSLETSPNAEEETGIRMVAFFDHEEIGSASAQGAASPLLGDAIRRVTGGFASPGAQGLVEQAIQRSFLVSADMAHCLHPNYQERYEENHQPKLHQGMVIKTNANQRYATNAVSAFLFRHIGFSRGLPMQDFVVRNDMACGSTIGPILASGLGLRTVDVGIPQLSMHSVREMCGTDDVAFGYEHFKAFFEDCGVMHHVLDVDS
eukprot:TRINITY_DN19633_c0_g2_i1.p1 TRINITY_DN19633_c0_g2~~TRINITY_DN19633_c0_g2_i1.p1  ORF type:complete len:579 (+),score=106.41 TRINITY_DN19633_c0_g2_i1:211-1737(+)